MVGSTHCYPYLAFTHATPIQKALNSLKKQRQIPLEEPLQFSSTSGLDLTFFFFDKCHAHNMHIKNEDTHLEVSPQQQDYVDTSSTPYDCDILQDDYPDGGLHAWGVVLGAWCALVPAFGIVNTVGVLEQWISEHQLSQYPKSTVSWIFSLWIFFFYLGGVQVGMLFHHHCCCPNPILYETCMLI